MKSMTGYGCAETAAAAFRMSLEIKSYNNRYLDIYVNVPSALSALEPRIREYLGARVLRGKVEVFLKVKHITQNLSVSFDPAVAQGYLAALQKLAELAGTGEEIRLSHLLQMEGIFKTEDIRGIEEYAGELESLLEKAFAGFEESRLREGAATEKDILALLDDIRKNAQAAAACAPEIEDHFSRIIRGRMEELLAGEIDEARIAAETAMLLVRYSIHEELARLASHCEAFLAAAAETGSIGRRLDFICQEINREVNTLGSKNVLAGVSRFVVAMKDSLENIREQIRNIE
ncbi:MAG: YicC family protein [Spirochaetaceae bacterium]|nr:YicC family protein [Spirochaetaceae bacterium]